MNKLEKDFLNSNILQEAKDWKQSLAENKFEYQKQKDAQKLNQQKQIEVEKIKQLRRQQHTEMLTTAAQITVKVLLFTIKIGLYIMAIPFYVAFFFLAGFVGGICKNK